LRGGTKYLSVHEPTEKEKMGGRIHILVGTDRGRGRVKESNKSRGLYCQSPMRKKKKKADEHIKVVKERWGD